MKTTILIIFCCTWVLIAARRLRFLPLGRPAATLVGAVAMILVGAITPEESYAAIDHDTIALLLGMMLITVYFERSGFFAFTSQLILSVCNTPGALLAGVALTAGVLSAFLVNDTVCLFLTPVVVAICRRAELPLGPYLIALATSSNIGSAATLVGNPQNMIIGSMSSIPFTDFLVRAAPPALLGLFCNLLLLRVYYRRELAPRILPSPPTAKFDRKGLIKVSLVLLGMIVAFFSGLHLGYTAITGALVLMLIERRDPHEVFERVDWQLLVFFGALFILIAGFAKTGLVDRTFEDAAPYMNLDSASGVGLFSSILLVGSNLLSNVPMVLLAGPHLGELGDVQLGWVLLAFVTTVAGNLTLLGSVANIIVAERSRHEYELGFFEYLRFGAVSTILVLAVGVPALCVWSSWLG